MKLQSLAGDAPVVAVAPDSKPDLEKMAKKVLDKAPGELRMILLSDADHAVINRYGLLNDPAAQKGRFLPHPTTYVIDRKGMVRWKFTEVDYKIRPTNEMVVEELKNIE